MTKCQTVYFFCKNREYSVETNFAGKYAILTNKIQLNILINCGIKKTNQSKHVNSTSQILPNRIHLSAVSNRNKRIIVVGLLSERGRTAVGPKKDSCLQVSRTAVRQRTNSSLSSNRSVPITLFILDLLFRNH